MIIGSIMLFESPLSFMRVSWKVWVPAVVLTTLFFLIVVGLAIKAQRKQPTTGSEGLVGEIGVAKTAIKREGQILLHGEIWKATSDKPIKKGDKVRVIAVNKLEVVVEKVS